MHMLVNQDHSKPAVFWNLHTSAHICILPRPHFSERQTHLPPGEEAKAVNW